MTQENNDNEEFDGHDGTKGFSGLGQKILGEIETIGGILTGDPNTQAEGEFNIEVGELREEIEEDLNEGDLQDAEEPKEKE